MAAQFIGTKKEFHKYIGSIYAIWSIRLPENINPVFPRVSIVKVVKKY